VHAQEYLGPGDLTVGIVVCLNIKEINIK